MLHPLHKHVQGVFFMCRRNQLMGVALLCFGLGLLVGCRLETGLARICLSVIGIGGGFLLLQQK